MSKILKVENMSVNYNNESIISDLNIGFTKNKITAIIGPSGCGKSTLLHSLNGLILENEEANLRGQISLDGHIFDYNSLNKKKYMLETLKEEIGIVFQRPLPFPISIEKNMEFVLKYHGQKKEERKKIVIDCLKKVNLYEEVKNDFKKNAKKLSGGQQQRLCIARALTVKPKILLLDEPCSSLDLKNINIIEKLLLDLKKKYTIILVTHNISQAKRIADEVVFMLDGKIIEHSSKIDFFKNPQNTKTFEYIKGDFG